jgi:hypothetical protein
MVDVVAVGPGPLSRADVVAVARAGAQVELTAQAYEAMAASCAHVEALALDERPRYGVPPASGRWPRGTSRRRSGRCCSSRWCGRTPLVRDPRWRPKWSGRWPCCGYTRWRLGAPACDRRRRWRWWACSMPASRRWCPSTARWVVPVTLRRWPQWHSRSRDFASGQRFTSHLPGWVRSRATRSSWFRTRTVPLGVAECEPGDLYRYPAICSNLPHYLAFRDRDEDSTVEM